MKRLFTIMLVLVALTLGAQAQSYKSAIGLRGGEPSGINFKTFLGSGTAIDLVAGTGYFGHNLNVSAFYEWQKPTDWAPGIDWFIGPGAHIGIWTGDYSDDYNSNLIVGLDGIIGLEYTFDDIPLNLSVGIGPAFHLMGGPNNWYYWNGGIAIRYVL